MTQRIEVRSLLKKDGRILLLRRKGRRDDLRGKYELPGGRVELGEQPEDAVARHIKESVGLEVQSSYLSDVFTYTDSANRDVQYAVIAYTASAPGSRGDVRLSAKYSKYAWKKLSDIQQDDVTEVSYALLGLHKESPGVSTTVDGMKDERDVVYTTKSQNGVIAYSDGGSRGNPGPSAAGYVIKDSGGTLMYEGGAYLGITTNNQAEYHGVRLGLEKAKEIGARSVEFYIDSMLVVNQLNGQYVIRNRELWPIHERIKELVSQFDKVVFRHVKREFNQQADAMVNRILDTRAQKKAPKIMI